MRRNIFVKNDKKEIQKTYTTLMGNGSSNVIMFSILFRIFDSITSESICTDGRLSLHSPVQHEKISISNGDANQSF